MTDLAEVERIEREWMMGANSAPTVHDALGWTADEYAAFKRTGEIPGGQPSAETAPEPTPDPPEPEVKPDQASAPWMHYSRWRAVYRSNRWYVVSESGIGDVDPGVFDDHDVAQRRADELNKLEREDFNRRFPT